MHVEVKSLAPAVQRALKSVAYGATDIKVIAAESVEGQVGANDGQRGFVLVLNLDTGAMRTVRGSWGGSNPFGGNLVDRTDERIELPANGAVIKGQQGYPRTFATIYAHPNAFASAGLPSGEPDEQLTDTEQHAIYCFAAIKGGEYRRDEMRRRGVTPAAVDGLVERGYLKRNRAGATQITTKGKNARTINR